MRPFRSHEGGVILLVKVLPKSSQNAIVGVEGERVKIKVQAPPDKGKANEAVVSLLAKELHMAASFIEIRAGEHARLKTVFLLRCTEEQIERLLSKRNRCK
jgi:uncharacterized protein (TIGR00251 family)